MLAALSACQSPTEPGLDVITFGVSPSSLDMVVGETVPMTIAALSARGDTVPHGAWIRPWVHGSAQLLLTACAGQVNEGHGCTITALTTGVDTIDFEIGNYYGCIDPPECTGRYWGTDTVITVLATVQ